MKPGRIMLAAIPVVLASCALQTLSGPAVAQLPEPAPFAFYHEFLGSRAYSDPQIVQNLHLGMMNGLTLVPPVDLGMIQTAASGGAGLMLRLPGSPGPAGMASENIESHRAAFHLLAESHPETPYFWNLMPEWDQSGGLWVAGGRPRYRGLTRAAAQERFRRFYEENHAQAMAYLRVPPLDRSYATVAVTDYAPNVYLAYELGVELQFLERGIDELGDLSTGIAFLRGAARQSGRRWGIDISTWRTGNNKATEFNDAGGLLGGWSASYLRRHFYASFLSGANALLNEAAVYRLRSGELNPMGEATQEFANFALRRHPDVGKTVVSAALLIPHDQGFDPKHGAFNQNNAVWYQDIPYSDGDFMMDNLLRVTYPGHWLHGLAPGALFANAGGVPDAARFRAFLASGGDPRPYEPMPSTRWGDNLDVITDRASADALANYKVIVLVGDVQLTVRLRADLAQWVREGGVLVMYAGQATPADEELLGVSLGSNTVRTATTSRWFAAGPALDESPFRYALVQPKGAEVLAVAGASDPLITRHRLGGGEAFLVSSFFGQASNRNELGRSGLVLLDLLLARFLPARVQGPPIEYVVNRSAGKIVVGLINNSPSVWTGEIVSQLPAGFLTVTDYVSDESVPFETSGSNAHVPLSISPYDVRVIAVE